MAQDRRKFIAKEVREEESKVCYEIWIDQTLLCVVGFRLSKEQRTEVRRWKSGVDDMRNL